MRVPPSALALAGVLLQCAATVTATDAPASPDAGHDAATPVDDAPDACTAVGDPLRAADGGTPGKGCLQSVLGAPSCAARTQSCCWDAVREAPACAARTGAATCAPGVDRFDCDGPEDCAPDEICCVGATPQDRQVCARPARCATGFRACHSDGDCVPCRPRCCRRALSGGFDGCLARCP